ncbi:MAG: Ryanodine receptor Ryr [Muribaculaceae bacterium]|nr:Ryanodine receptor Ryr [Muribaculaceae bacterium]
MVAVSASPVKYDPQPIDVTEIDLDADLEDLTEAIAENAHDIWARARMDEGWTYGPVRNDELKQHPDLVPYSQLPDSEKEYDRLMAMNTLRLVRRLGYRIETCTLNKI